VVDFVKAVNAACGHVSDFFDRNRDLQPTREFVQKHGPSVHEVVDQLERAARGEVTFVGPSATPSAHEQRLSPAMSKFLEKEYGVPGYLPNSVIREQLIDHVQERLQSPGGQPLVMDGRIGPQTARALLEDLRKYGLEPSPCFK
jgi:hypothetical protein